MVRSNEWGSLLQEDAQAALERALGPSATFRGQQLEAIAAIVEDRRRVLLIQRTGWGKSIVYFIATRLLRDRGSGPTLLISPLLALMRDQVKAAARLGLVAVTINSSNADEWRAVEARLERGEVDLLLVSPERLNNVDFRERLLGPMASAAGLLVVDEAHCISDWGHDFRPDYRRIGRLLSLLPADSPVLATTATANHRVTADISEQLGIEPLVLRGPLHRESLRLSVLGLNTKAERLAFLSSWVPLVRGSGIVYCLTVSDTKRVAGWLQEREINAVDYSGDTSSQERMAVEDALRGNQVKVVVATSALGMGFDKPDLGFVVHFQSPDSPIAYYQQVGRAGRSLDSAEAVLLIGSEDEEIWTFFLESSLPSQGLAERMVSVLADRADWCSLTELDRTFNVNRARLKGLLNVLEVEGALERDGQRYRRTLRAWTFEVERYARVRAHRLAEQQLMRDYSELATCRMQFLLTTLDDRDADPCGRCDNCLGLVRRSPGSVSEVARAAEFLRGRPLAIEPRTSWPGGLRSGLIPTDLRLEEGRALSELGDGGWGGLVLQCKRAQTLFPDDLVAAAAALIRQWSPEPALQAIVYVPPWDPGRRFVPDLAERLASALGLPVLRCVSRTRPTGRQKEMQNSTHQFQNVIGAYVVPDPVEVSSVLLVDDVSDSRWTMTVVGEELRNAGVRHVWPFTLARTKG